MIILIYGNIILINREGNTLDHVSYDCSSNSEWGLWRCPGSRTKCTAKMATRYKCIGGSCTENSPCAKLKNHAQSDSCVKVLRRGECEPWWTNWSPWSQCTETCGVAEKYRVRFCTGAFNYKSYKYKVKKSISQSCASIERIHERIQKVPCPVSRLCSVVNGGWGRWSEFSECSVTCGEGKRIRRRHCTHPRPQGGGLYCQGTDYQEVLCEGHLPCPRMGQWCSWSPVTKQCTRHCGKRGMGLRIRQCACPKPSQDGAHCEIPPEAAEMAANLSTITSVDAPTGSALTAIMKGEALWEPCNRHHCPYRRTLSTEEDSLILGDLNLQRAADTWKLSGGLAQRIHSTLKLFCPSSLTSRMEIFDKSDRFPKSKSYWTRSIPKNSKEPYDTPGEPIVNSNLYIVEDDHLTIHRLQPSTMGIYRFGYEYEPGYFETVCFFPVYIHQWKQVLPHGVQFDLFCNALGLWPIISKSTTRWFVYWNVTLFEKGEQMNINKNELWWYTEVKNPHVSKQEEDNKNDKEDVNPTNVSTQFTLWDTEYRRLYETVETMTGYYECRILNKINSTYNRTFITQSIHLVIKPPPSIWTLFKEWCSQYQISLLVLYLLAMITSLLYATYLWVLTENLTKEEIQMIGMDRPEQNENFNDAYVIN
ncbi:unnamed protein product [Schistosoma turkestanicum]|nr:unnamed protein product [Schistosoma turkestanicum]